MMNELTDLTITRQITIKLQELILLQINTSIEELNLSRSKETSKNEINTILCELKEELFVGELKKVVEYAKWFLSTYDSTIEFF